MDVVEFKELTLVAIEKLVMGGEFTQDEKESLVKFITSYGIKLEPNMIKFDTPPVEVVGEEEVVSETTEVTEPVSSADEDLAFRTQLLNCMRECVSNGFRGYFGV
jgi:hypothetical protein